MKETICILVAAIAPAAFAQSLIAAGSESPDLVQMVSMEQLPLGAPKAELDKARAKAQTYTVAKADDGVSSIELAPEMVQQFMNNLDLAKRLAATPQNEAIKHPNDSLRAPVIFKDLTELKLGFGPAAFNKGVLIGASPSGTIIGSAWTGVDRYYRIDGAGHARLSESDMKATGGKFYMLKSEINTTVGGKPAISKVFTDDKGLRVEEVLWVSGSKLYMLTFAPDMQAGRYGTTKSNSRISASSLASDLK